MLIIVSGLMLSIGISQTSLFGTMGMMAEHSSNVAESAQAKNIAYMGAELAIRDMIDDPSWRDGETARYSVGSGTADITLTEVEANVMRVVSKGSYNGHENTVNLLLGESSSGGVPTFFSALGLIMDDPGEFIFDAGGSSGISGYDASGSCDPVPGVTVVHDSDKSYIESNSTGASKISGDPQINVDSELTFDEMKKLIDDLDGPGATYLPAGNYKGTLGTESNPGIFIVNDRTKITGNNTGYGILIIKNSGAIELDAELELRGTMQFNGLVIFENAFAIDGKGTAEIRGSVLAGKSNPNAPDFDVDLGGTADFRYDCSAQKYADAAAAGYVNSQTQFKRLSVYEN
jgi:hypothetical protein